MEVKSNDFESWVRVNQMKATDEGLFQEKKSESVNSNDSILPWWSGKYRTDIILWRLKIKIYIYLIFLELYGCTTEQEIMNPHQRHFEVLKK